ncbi:MAG: peptide chain release factor N(5)-glutamine methyltransferase [Clostridia bacterium]|nr:peptide chain release factor N(5)-glutamine methyltransferase [Clostridia bacterium]
MTADIFYRKLRTALLPIAGEASAYEAKELADFILNLKDSELTMLPFLKKEIPAAAETLAESLLRRRVNREPLEYILGYAWFYGLRFSVSSDCLIPQADTEIVCEKLISHLQNGMRFADICTGSGCIALTALVNIKNTTAVGYDISDGALAIANKNAEIFGLSTRFEAKKSDVFAEDFLADAGEFDMIVSNPPYIETDVIGTLSLEVQNEPHIALDGGADGLRFYRRLLEICPKHLKKGGLLLLEIGYDQKAPLTKLCETKGFSYEFYRDFGGNDRVLAVWQ